MCYLNLNRVIKIVLVCFLVVTLGLITISTSQPRMALAAGTVTDCSNDTQLRAYLASGGLVTFNCGASPVTITLGSQLVIAANTTVDGGSNITLSGGNVARVFSVTTGTNLTLQNLTVANGKASPDANGDAYGGGLYSTGGVTLSNTNFLSNSATGNDKTITGNDYIIGGNAYGGGIYSVNGTVNIISSTFAYNAVRGGNISSATTFGGVGGSGSGGGLDVMTSTVTISNSNFLNNSVIAGNGGTASGGGDGGTGFGGGLFSSNQVTITGSTFSSNTVKGGKGGDATGGSNYLAGQGQEASGGAIASTGPLNINTSTFENNSVTGGDGGISNAGFNQSGSGGSGLGAAIYNSNDFTLLSTTIVSNTAFGGISQGFGINSSALGGGIYQNSFIPIYHRPSKAIIANSTIGANKVIGGQTIANNSYGSAEGAGIDNEDNYYSIILTNTTLYNNTTNFSGQNIYGFFSLANSIVAFGPGVGGLNCDSNDYYAQIDDKGYNLEYPTQDICYFSNHPVTGDPKLGPLANNGGNTQTLALQVGSAAIDNGNDAICAAAPLNYLDQRGVTRFNGLRCDVGAYEATSAIPPNLNLELSLALSRSIVDENQPSTLTFFLKNYTTQPLNSVSFTATVPTANSINFSSLPINGCNSGTVNLNNGTLTVGGVKLGANSGSSLVCAISVNITGIKPGTFSIMSGPISSDETGSGSSSNPVSLTVRPGSPATITALAGTPQTTGVNTAFPVRFVAVVKDGFGNGLSNIGINFNASMSGFPAATGFFIGGGSSVVITSDASGIVTAPVFMANQYAGNYGVFANLAANYPRLEDAIFSLTSLAGPPAIVYGAGQTFFPFCTNTTYNSYNSFKAGVTDSYNNPLMGIPVTFTAPSTGPSGVFSGSNSISITVATGEYGQVSVPGFITNNLVGSFTVTATVSGVITPAILTAANGSCGGADSDPYSPDAYT